jgi:hypothetical protein
MTKLAKPQEQSIEEMPGSPMDCFSAYHRWVDARAKLLEPKLSEDTFIKIMDTEIDAARALAASRSKGPEEVHYKIEALRYYITDFILNGRLGYPIEPFLISSIQNDLFVLGIGARTK